MDNVEKVNILLVDDSPANLVALEASLSDLEQNLIKADSGMEALRCLLKQDFAAILLDVQMPRMDGFETATLIRERDRSKHTPIIFITAIGTTLPDVTRGYSVGAVDYIVKPYDVQILKSKVAVFIDMFRMQQAVQRQAVELTAVNRQLRQEIGERERTTAQLRQLSAHLQSAREDERMIVAREIHDELGQLLTAVQIDLDLLERDLSQPDTVPGTETICSSIHATRQLVNQVLQRMHEIIRELRPEVLDHLGLQDAIEWQVQEFQTRSRIECQCAITEEDLRLDRERSTALFRVLQEALTNVARHAQATRVQIQLVKQDHQVILQISDNGRGISDAEISNPASFGILGMRERALAFGGRVDLHSEPGKGTDLTVYIPIEELRDASVDRPLPQPNLE